MRAYSDSRNGIFDSEYIMLAEALRCKVIGKPFDVTENGNYWWEASWLVRNTYMTPLGPKGLYQITDKGIQALAERHK